MNVKIEKVAAITLLFVLGSWVKLSFADDCEWNKEQLNNYNAVCSTVDGCGSRDTMVAIVKKSCGQANGNSPSQQQGSTRSKSQDQPNNDKPTSVGFSSSSSASNSKPTDRDDYSGQSCVFFTRPAVEVVDGVVRQNAYADGAKVCYKEVLYVCEKSKWQRLRDCPASVGSEKMKAEEIESGRQ
jgi:hypothetical protein